MRGAAATLLAALALVLAPAPAHGGDARQFFNPAASIDASQIDVRPAHLDSGACYWQCPGWLYQGGPRAHK